MLFRSLSLLVLRRELSNWAEAPKYEEFALPVMPYSSPLAGVRRVLGGMPLADDAGAKRYLARLDDLPALAQAIEGKLRDSASRGIVIARDEIDNLLPSLDRRPSFSSLRAPQLTDAITASAATPQKAKVRDMRAGQALGYGGTFVTKAPARIGVLPVGYADGLNRGDRKSVV